MFKNQTRNQHYISQVEQKLNCIDINVTRKNRRIYEFEVLDRECNKFQITNPSGVRISSNLSFNDLYSLDIFEDSTRENFEKFFNILEHKIEDLSNQLLNSESISLDQVKDFFSVKLMNIIRNPFCITKAINEFGKFCNFYPTDEYMLSFFRKIDTLTVNEEILSNFDITSDMYKKWLKIIFYTVIPFKYIDNQEYSFLKRIVSEVFDTNKNMVKISLFHYDKPSCLLSDRGFVDLNSTDDFINYGFNINKNSFIVFSFTPNNLDSIARSSNIPFEELAFYKEKGIDKLLINKLEIKKIINDVDALNVYNQNVIYQAHKKFYAAFQYTN